MWVEPDLTLYVVSMTTNRVAVVPSDGSEAVTYDVTDQLQPYPQSLQPGIVPLQDRILLYRLSISGRGIDVLQLDRNTGIVAELALDSLMSIVSCATFPHISRRALLGVDGQRAVLCSEGPVHHYNVHIVNLVTQSVEQTISLGSNDLANGRPRPWVQLEVGLDENIYFIPYLYNTYVWGIDIPENIQNYQIKYDTTSQEFSLSPLLSPTIPQGMYVGPVLIDEEENKYFPYTGGTLTDPRTELYKIDINGNVIWRLDNPPMPDDISSIMLVDDGQLVVWNYGAGTFISDQVPTQI